ncbi:MAG: hypothetical protein WEB13_00955 [Dehalococcoidia bacterium]
MSSNFESEISRVRGALDALRADVDRLGAAGAEAIAAAAVSTPVGSGGEQANRGNVVVTSAGGNLAYTGTFAAGPLSLTMDAIVDQKTGRTVAGHEIVLHQDLGEVFKRTHGVAQGLISVRYDFGPAVEGVNTLVLVGEASAANVFIHGQVDGFALFPSRVTKQGCSCDGTANSAVMVDLGDGKARPLAVAFPDAYTEALKPLMEAIATTVAAERYLRGNLESLAFSGCFWGTVACELAAKACILGCAGNPFCMAACLLAEVACLLALDESKRPATAVLV